MVKKSVIFRAICVTLITAFCFENVAWANPDVLRRKPSGDTLQVQSFFNPMFRSDWDNILRTELEFLLGSIDNFDNFNLRLDYPKPGTGLYFYLDFSSEQPDDNGNRIVDCRVATSRSSRSYEAVIGPDKHVVELRKPGSKRKPTAADLAPQISQVDATEGISPRDDVINPKEPSVPSDSSRED